MRPPTLENLTNLTDENPSVSYYTVCCTLCWHLTLAIQYFLTAYVTWTLLNVNGLNTLYAINPSMVSGSIQCKAFCLTVISIKRMVWAMQLFGLTTTYFAWLGVGWGNAANSGLPSRGYQLSQGRATSCKYHWLNTLSCLGHQIYRRIHSTSSSFSLDIVVLILRFSITSSLNFIEINRVLTLSSLASTISSLVIGISL